jgi:cell division protein FtsN
MRVQIALSGLEASVKAAEVPGRGRLHRVRVGPFATLGEANRVKASLSQNGISTTLVRVDDTR